MLLVLAAGTGATMRAAERIEIAWPTANRAFLERRPLEDFIQPTESGETASGLFGCVRTNGTQFNEALDLKPIQRDRAGEATDPVFAVLDGVVRHVSQRPGESSYGRYIVLEHTEQLPAVYTLYAHLRSIDPAVQVGQNVRRSQQLGIMGRSAGGYTIPKERAHLHFEIGLRLTDRFQSWYDWKEFGNRNQHGIWNGMNLVGIDPLEFYTQFRDRQVDHFTDYLRRIPIALRIQIATTVEPDFVRRYPELLTRPAPLAGLAGWEVAFTVYGVPTAWTPLSEAEVAGFQANEVRVVSTTDDLLRACRCKDLVTRTRSGPRPARDLQTLLQLLFGLRR
ncbi:MAG TPA: M23 family metallopeptidase [Candidatus Synoicihabitans sp.]|nr:M23 family metallopeptidase [Candidatus Synoicihabitans sp.]